MELISSVLGIVILAALAVLAWWLISRAGSKRKKIWTAVAVGAFVLWTFVLPIFLPSDVGTVVYALGWIFLVVALYIILCELVAKAAERKGRSATAWFFIAFFFGLIIPAVIVAIIGPDRNATAIDSADMYLVQCPYCAEDIRPEAIKCKHCGERLPSTDAVD